MSKGPTLPTKGRDPNADPSDTQRNDGELTEMSFAGIVFACWLLIAAFAFVALSAIARTAAASDEEADLGIVGAAELRMLLPEPAYVVDSGRALLSSSWDGAESSFAGYAT
jgi:hypothetical protein